MVAISEMSSSYVPFFHLISRSFDRQEAEKYETVLCNVTQETTLGHDFHVVGRRKVNAENDSNAQNMKSP